YFCFLFFFFQAEDGIRDRNVTGVQTCALPISYLTDVGFGDSARIPVPFNGEMRKDVSGAYRLEYVAPNVYDLKWNYSSGDEWSRSEERRVGKGGRGRWRSDCAKKRGGRERSVE